MKRPGTMPSRAARVATVLLVCGAIVLVSTAVWSMVMSDAPDEVLIDTYASKKKAVHYPHKLHVDKGIACKDCHHTLKEGETPQACTECHKAKKDGDTPEAKKAFHESCQECHKKTKKKGDKTGPTTCATCHAGPKAAAPEKTDAPDKAEPEKAEPEKAEPEKTDAPDKAEPEKAEPEKAEPEKTVEPEKTDDDDGDDD